MSFRSYAIAMLLGTLVSWAAWLLVLWQVNPETAGTTGLVLFYASLLLSLLGTFALLGLVFRHLKVRKHFLVEKVVTSFRQGLWFAVIIVASLALQHEGLLSWLNVLLVVLLVTVLEFFFLSAVPRVNLSNTQKDSGERYI